MNRARRIPSAAVSGSTGSGAPTPATRGPLIAAAAAPPPDGTTIGVAVGQPPVQRRLDLDPELAAHVTKLVAQAHTAGHLAGRAEGERAAMERADQLARSVALAVGEIEHVLERDRQAATGGIVELAVAIAETVIGRTPHDGGAAVVARIADALDHLDERPLTVRVAEDDLSAVRAAAEGLDDVVVQADASLSPGEARVSGAWSHADLTRAAAWAAIQRMLDEP